MINTDTPFRRVFEACESLGLEPTKSSGGWYRAKHPCSPKGDTAKSFAFIERGDGIVNFRSQKGSYNRKDCLESLNLTWEDLYPNSKDYGTYVGKKVSSRRDFVKYDGRYVGSVLRIDGEDGEKKTFAQGSYVKGNFVPGLKEDLPLYPIIQLVQWVEDDETIYVNEGEKCADAMILAGYAGCTKSGGSGKTWSKEDLETLKGANVVIVADKDAPGYKYATRLAGGLQGIAKSIKIVEAKEGNDAFDHLEAGFKAEDFVDRSDLIPKPRVLKMSSVPPAEPIYLFDDWTYFRVGQCNLLDAMGGAGKTSLAIAVACCGSNGVSPKGVACEKFSTLYHGAEDPEGEMASMIKDLGGDPEYIHMVNKPFNLDERAFEILEEDIKGLGVKFVVFDAAKYYLPPGRGGGSAEFDAKIVVEFVTTLREMAHRLNVCVLLVRHFAKHTEAYELNECGAGISQWRDSCRSQVVMLPIPGKRGNAVAWHTKGSIRAQTQEPFAVGWSFGNYTFWAPQDSDFKACGYDSDGHKIKEKRKEKEYPLPSYFE